MIETANTPEVSGRDVESPPELPVPVDHTELRGERFSIAASLEKSFAEIDADGGLPMEYYYPRVPVEVLPDDRDVIQTVMKKVMQGLKESSTVKQARLTVKTEGAEAIDKHERRALLAAFERIRDRALNTVDMTEEQRRRLTFETKSELNRSLHSAILTGAAPETWMILFPKLRKIEALSSDQAIRYLKNLLAPKHSDIIKAEIKAIKQMAGESAEAKKALTEAEKDATLAEIVKEEGIEEVEEVN